MLESYNQPSNQVKYDFSNLVSSFLNHKLSNATRNYIKISLFFMYFILLSCYIIIILFLLLCHETIEARQLVMLPK